MKRNLLLLSVFGIFFCGLVFGMFYFNNPQAFHRKKEQPVAAEPEVTRTFYLAESGEIPHYYEMTGYVVSGREDLYITDIVLEKVKESEVEFLVKKGDSFAKGEPLYRRDGKEITASFEGKLVNIQEEQVGEGRVGEEQVGEEQVGEEQVREEQVREEQVGEEQVGEEQVGEEQVGEEQVREEQVGEEQVREAQVGEGRAEEKQAGEKNLRLRLLNYEQLYITGRVAEDVAFKMGYDTPTVILLDGEEYPARISDIGYEVAGKTVEVRIAFSAGFLPGTETVVRFTRGIGNGIYIARNALYQNGVEWYVSVMRDGYAIPQRVKTGQFFTDADSGEEFVEIINGLSAGDTAVVEELAEKRK